MSVFTTAWADIMDSKIAYSIAQFCEAAGVGRTFVYSEIASGRLRAVKARGRTLITQPDAQSYIEKLPAFVAKVSEKPE